MFDGYNSIKHIGIPNAIITNLWQEITGTYITSFDNLFATLNTIPGSKILISFFIGFWFLVMIVYQQKRLTDLKRWGIISYYCAVVLLPIVANIQYIVSKTAYHVLMLYSIHFLMIIPVVFLEKTYDDTETDCLDNRHNVSGIGIRNRFEGRVGYVVRMGTYGLVIIAIFLNIRYANNVYTEKYMRERSTLSLMTRIMSRAEETEGYIPGEMPIIIVGEIGNNISVGEKNPAYFGTQIGDASKFISITYDINSYLRYYLGYDTLEDDYYLKDNVNVINMPAFPEKGFAKILDGKLIIKVASNN